MSHRVSSLRRGRVLALFAIACAVVLGAGSAPTQAASPSPDFHGVVPQGPLTQTDFRQMAAGGVDTARIGFAWYELEPSPGIHAWERIDAIVLNAARHGIRILPTLSGSPEWATGDGARPPIFSDEQREGWAAFVRRLVQRYGPGGQAWVGVARPRPIRVWQVWNEPNFPRFFQPEPSPRAYAKLLTLSSQAIRSVDREAKVMLAGVAPVISGERPDGYLKALYSIRRIKRSFDIVALHPYARGVGRLAAQVGRVRDVMRRARDAKTPLAITEMGWASKRSPGTPEGGATRGRRGQARMITRAYNTVERHRSDWRLDSAYWFAWQDSPEPELHCSFCQYAGLFDVAGRRKPSWGAYRRAAASP